MTALRKIMAYAPLKVNGWSLAMTTTKSEVTKALQQLSLNSIIICLVVSAIIILSVFFLVNSLIKPIQTLGRTAREIAAGNLQVHVDADTEDEVGLFPRTYTRLSI